MCICIYMYTAIYIYINIYIHINDRYLQLYADITVNMYTQKKYIYIYIYPPSTGGNCPALVAPRQPALQAAVRMVAPG